MRPSFWKQIAFAIAELRLRARFHDAGVLQETTGARVLWIEVRHPSPGLQLGSVIELTKGQIGQVEAAQVRLQNVVLPRLPADDTPSAADDDTLSFSLDDQSRVFRVEIEWSGEVVGAGPDHDLLGTGQNPSSFQCAFYCGERKVPGPTTGVVAFRGHTEVSAGGKARKNRQGDGDGSAFPSFHWLGFG